MISEQYVLAKLVMIPGVTVGPLWDLEFQAELTARAEIMEGDVWGALKVEHYVLG